MKAFIFLLAIFFARSWMGTAGPAKEVKYPVSEIPSSLLQNARSVVRREEITFELLDDNHFLKKELYVITVLNDNGLEDADFWAFYDKFSRVKNIRAVLYNSLGEKEKTIPFDQILDASAISGFSIYDDNRLKYIDPNYRNLPFTMEYYHEVEYSGGINYARWDPVKDHNIAVEKSVFTLVSHTGELPRFFERNLPTPGKGWKEESDLFHQWELSNWNAVKYERLSHALDDVSPGVLTAPSDFTYEGYSGNFSSWKEFGEWVNLLNSGKNNLPVETVERVKSMVAACKNDLEKTRMVYEYLQGKTRYVSVQVGIGGYQPFDAGTVDRLSYGDCKALSYYTKSLLEAAGIPSYYTLIRAGNMESDLLVDFPSAQFNHAILCVPLGEDTVWLECTSQRNPFGYLSTFTDDRYALVINDQGGTITRTKSYSDEDSRLERKALVKLTIEGHAEVEMDARFIGLFYDELAPVFYADDTDKKKIVHEMAGLPEFDLIEYNFYQSGDILPIVGGKLIAGLGGYSRAIGTRMVMNLNLFRDTDHLVSVTGARKNDIVIRRPFTLQDTITYVPPQGYIGEVLPADVVIESKFGTYRSWVRPESEKIVFIKHLTVNKGTYPPEDLTGYQEFYDKVIRELNKKIALINKT